MTWVRIVVNRLRQVGAYEHEGSLFNRLKSVGLNAKTILDVVMPILLNMAEGDLRFLLGMRLVPAARMHEMANIVSVVRMGMGLQKVSVSVNVYTGDLLAQMAQISRQGVTYVINVSEEYLNTHVINKERVAAVMKAGQFKHVEDAKKKLIEWYFEEELIEGIWRYHDLDPAKDAAYQKKAHDAWQTLGLNVIPNLQLQKPEYFKDKPGTHTPTVNVKKSTAKSSVSAPAQRRRFAGSAVSKAAKHKPHAKSRCPPKKFGLPMVPRGRPAKLVLQRHGSISKC
jgi:hypothetical protein